MFRLRSAMQVILTHERGQSLVEYALLLVVLALGVAAFTKGCSTQIKFAISAITSQMAYTY